MADESPRLDMCHGFVKSILKNQVDRDEFERNERVRTIQGRERKRKSQAMYVPPHLRGALPKKTDGCEEQDATSSAESEAPHLNKSDGRIILQLFLEMKTGLTRKLEVHQGEDVKETVKKFALENGLDERLKKALLYKVKQALEPRSS